MPTLVVGLIDLAEVDGLLFLVALLAAASGFSMGFSAFAFLWTWYVGAVVILFSPHQRAALPATVPGRTG